MAFRCGRSRVAVHSLLHKLHTVDDDNAMVAFLVAGDTDGMAADVDELQKNLVNRDGLFAVDEAESVVVGQVACLTDEGLLYSSQAVVDLEGAKCPSVVAAADLAFSDAYLSLAQTD